MSKKSKQKTLPQTLTLRRDETQPESMEILAQSIIDIDIAFKRWENGPLKRHTIILLLADATKLPRRDVKRIIEAASKIRQTYLK